MAEDSSLWTWTKRTFLKGLATLLPALLTIYVFLVVFNFVRYSVSVPVNTFVGSQLYTTEWGRKYLNDRFEIPLKDPQTGEPLEKEALKSELESKLPWWPGFIIAFLAVMAVGFFIASFIGRRIYWSGEHLLTRIPVVKVIYPYAKQVTEFVFGGKKEPSYSSVVAVQYPRPGIWTMGFVTGDGIKGVKDRVGKTMLNVFLPCSPAPMSGFAIIVARDEVIHLDLTVDEAMRFIISAGVLVPEQQLTEEGKTRVLQESGRFPAPEEGGEEE